MPSISIKDQLVDALIKPLPAPAFTNFMRSLDLVFLRSDCSGVKDRNLYLFIYSKEILYIGSRVSADFVNMHLLCSPPNFPRM
jgi:hypothetical protein